MEYMMMKTKSIVFMAAFFIITHSAPAACLAENIRKPAYAGSFYPAAKSDIVRMMEVLTSKSNETRFTAPSGKSLKALIMPHAGYIYSGLTASHASLVLSGSRFSKVILIGPDHRIGFTGCAISDSVAYETPLGPVRLHNDVSKLKLQKELFRSIPLSDKN
jgi:hypothetical protein